MPVHLTICYFARVPGLIHIRCQGLRYIGTCSHQEVLQGILPMGMFGAANTLILLIVQMGFPISGSLAAYFPRQTTMKAHIQVLRGLILEVIQ